MVGVLCLIWVFYYRNYVLAKTRANLNILNAKDSILNADEPLQLNPANLSSLPNTHNSVPWKDILNQPSFW